jgi:hypothetical protein
VVTVSGPLGFTELSRLSRLALEEYRVISRSYGPGLTIETTSPPVVSVSLNELRLAPFGVPQPAGPLYPSDSESVVPALRR